MSTLPHIIRFLDTTDAGEYGAASCPHCGAQGCYVLHFVLADGRRAGAMRGCVKLFSVSPVAREELRLREKAAERAKKGWKLNGKYLLALAAIEEFYAGNRDARSTVAVVNSAKRANQQALGRRWL